MSENTISRQAAIEELKKVTFTMQHPVLGCDLKLVNAENAVDRITALPSAQPKNECEKCIFKPFKQFNPERKKGKWEYDDEAFPGGNPYGHYDCDQCGESVPHKTNYCPNCGADMREEAEDE